MKNNKKIAVILHLFYDDMWDEISTYLNNLGNYKYDLYVNIVDGFTNKDIIEKIKEYKEDSYIIISENRGVDIGGFLYVYKELKGDYDYILKLHTKKSIGLPNNPSAMVRREGYNGAVKIGKDWFDAMIKSVLGTKERVDEIIKLLELNNVGCIGHRIHTHVGPNINFIKNLCILLNITYQNKIEFIDGTIFWIKNEILKRYLTEEKINKLLEILPLSYTHEPSYNHAFERIFGLIVNNNNNKIIEL